MGNEDKKEKSGVSYHWLMIITLFLKKNEGGGGDNDEWIDPTAIFSFFLLSVFLLGSGLTGATSEKKKE